MQHVTMPGWHVVGDDEGEEEGLDVVGSEEGMLKVGESDGTAVEGASDVVGSSVGAINVGAVGRLVGA